MDLVDGANRVIVMTHHAAKDGSSKIIDERTPPLTSRRCVHRIITDLGVIDITDGKLVLREVAPGVSADQVPAARRTALGTCF